MIEQIQRVITNIIERIGAQGAAYGGTNVLRTVVAYYPVNREWGIYPPTEANATTNHYNSFSWTYLPGSNLKSSLVYPNGMTASWAYDANNQLLQVRNATLTNVISQYDYTYDVAGRRIGVSKSGSAFAQNDSIEYAYNEKSELTNAVAAVNSNYRYAYDFDDFGNRISSLDLGTNCTYTANNLNQYTQISNLCDSASLREEFIPQFDNDGNQTLIQTATGIWSVTYNGENRPILWTLVLSSAPNSSTPPLLHSSRCPPTARHGAGLHWCLDL